MTAPRPNLRLLFAAGLVALAGALAVAAQSGAPLAYHAYSECQADGFWHVVTDTYYDAGNGQVRKVRTYDYRTVQPCRDGNGNRIGEPPRVRDMVQGARNSVQMQPTDYQTGVADGEIVELRCEGETWKRYHYDAYRMPDGTRKRHHTPNRVETTNIRCTEKPPPPIPDREVIDGGTAEGVGTTSSPTEPMPPVRLGDPIRLPNAPARPGTGTTGLGKIGTTRPDPTSAAMIYQPGSFYVDPGRGAPPAEVPVANAAVTDRARPDDRAQLMAGSLLSFDDHQIVIAHDDTASDPRPIPAGDDTSRGSWWRGVFAFLRPADALRGMSAMTGSSRAWRPASSTARTGAPWRGDDDDDAGQSGAPPLIVAFTSLGQSSGAAFTMTIVRTGGAPLALSAAGFVLEPVDRVSGRDLAKALDDLKGTRTTATINAYCLEMPKTPPSPGAIYRLAPAAVQARYPMVGRVMDATRRLARAGALHPDQDAAEYFDAIRQWSLWSIQENLRSVEDFTRALVAQARKTLEAGGGRWTDEIDQAIRSLAPNRWGDITQVLEAAGVTR